LSCLTFGTVASALPAHASTGHSATVRPAGENDDTPDDTSNSSGGGSTPSGGAATGAGGTAVHEATHDSTPWLLTGAAGFGLLGTSAVAAARRRRSVDA
jgi:hypothetical protein